MSPKYKFGDSDTLYFISFAIVNLIDVFVIKEYKDILMESWRYERWNASLRQTRAMKRCNWFKIVDV